MGGLVQEGIRALLKSHRRLVQDGASAACSLDVERAVGDEHVARFDYLIGLADGAVAMEVHRASPGEVEAMIRKKRGTLQVLHRECPSLAVGRWAWVLPFGSPMGIVRNSAAERQLAAAGIGFPERILRLQTGGRA